eukprot:GHVR01124804.1.p1 GENE.GHVR01124804.1~~GHVR01124804.1.p1  ORF type:complete len:141 (+),score=46.71 GHVR01124804.1:110-532(+)
MGNYISFLIWGPTEDEQTETKIETERETERVTETETARETKGETERETERETGRGTERETERGTQQDISCTVQLGPSISENEFPSERTADGAPHEQHRKTDTETVAPVTKKVYSWDKKRLDPNDFMFSKRSGETLTKGRG